MVRNAWNAFMAACNDAVTNPQGYLDSHPNAAHSGLSQVVSSPDGQVVVAERNEGTLHYSFEFMGVPGRLAVLCQVHAVDGLPNMFSAPVFDYSTGTINVPTPNMTPAHLIANALQNVVSSTPNTTISGGRVRTSEFVAQHLPGVPDFANYIFAVQTYIAGKPAFIYANAHPSTLSLISLNYIEAGQ